VWSSSGWSWSKLLSLEDIYFVIKSNKTWVQVGSSKEV